MSEHRTIDEVMDGREVRPGGTATEEPAGSLTTADMAGTGRVGEAPQNGRTEPAPAAPPSPAPEAAAAPTAAAQPKEEQARQTPLFSPDKAESLRSRWQDVQTGFVDEPRRAVEQADTLVAEVMQRLAKTFADERSKLEGQWSQGDNVSTEDLRMALRRYRSFFDRLLSI